MAYILYFLRNPKQQTRYLWDKETYDSVLEIVRQRSILPIFNKYSKPGGIVFKGGCGPGA
jgi:hypothetical protein